MKIRRIIKKGLSIVMSLALMLTLLLNVGVVELKAAKPNYVILGGNVIETSASAEYYYNVNDDGTTMSAITSTPVTDYDAHLVIDDTTVTLTLNNMSINTDSSAIGVTGDGGQIDIELIGENTITYVGSTDAFAGIEYTDGTINITGEGTLNMVADTCATTGLIKAEALNISDSAKLSAKISSMNASANILVNVTSFVMSDNASMTLNAGDGSVDITGLKVLSGICTIEGTSNLKINTGSATDENYGIWAPSANIRFTTTGQVDVTAGSGGYPIGIFTSGVYVKDTKLTVASGVASGMSVALQTTGNGGITFEGNADASLTGGKGSESRAIYMALGAFTMQNNAKLNAVASEATTNKGILFEGNPVYLYDKSSMTVTVEDTTNDSFGIYHMGQTITLSGQSSLTVESGNAGNNSQAIYAKSLTVKDSAKVDSTAGSSTNGVSIGIFATNGITAQNNAYISGTGGDVSGSVPSLGLDVNTGGLISVNDNATVIAKTGAYVGSGTAYGNCAVYNVGDCEVNGGTLEAISDVKAFNKAPILDDTVDFLVKAGATKASATEQNATQIADAATYTGNSYVLIKAVQTIERVDLSDIDELVHGESADTTAKTDTEGVGLKIPVTWAPTGDIVGGTEYTGTITITPIDGYVFADDVEVYYGSEKLTTALQADGSVKATYIQTADKTDLVSVENPDDVTGVANGTALKDIPLPEKTAITTASGSDEANITWDLTSVNYDPTSKEEQTFTVSGTIVAPNYVYTSNVNLNVSIKVTVKAAATTATTEEPTTTSTEDTTTQAPATTSTEDVTTQAPGGSMTDTEAPTTATTATTTEAPDNSDANVKTGDSAPLNVMLVLMLLAGIGMIVVGKKKSE